MQALGLEFKSPAPHKKLGVVIHACNPSTLEGWRPKLVGVIGVSQPISKFSETLSVQKKGESDNRQTTNDLLPFTGA